METNEIMQNEEIVECVSEATEVACKKCWKAAVGVGLTMAVGILTYRFIVKPMITNRKAKNEQSPIVEAEIIDDETEVSYKETESA